MDRGVGRLVVTAIWTYFKVCVLFYRGVCTWSVTAVRRPTRCINPYMAGGLMVRQEPKAVINLSLLTDIQLLLTLHSVLSHKTLYHEPCKGAKSIHINMFCVSIWKSFGKFFFGATLYKITITWLVFHMP